MLAKTLQVIGALLAFFGLVGEKKLARWESRIRAAIKRAVSLNWARRIIARVGNWFASLWSMRSGISIGCLIPFSIVVIIILFIGDNILTGMTGGPWQLILYQAKKADPAGYARSTLITWAIIIPLFVIIFLLGEKYPRIWDITGRLGRAYAIVTFAVLYGIVAIPLIALLALLLLGGLAIMIVVVSVLALGFFIVRLGLLPYQILDLLVVRLELKSTIIAIGLICALVGTLLQ